MSKFTVAGISIHNGRPKVRFCSDKVLRIKNLQKQGDQNINLIDLPNEMTKQEACSYLLTLGEFRAFVDVVREALAKKSTKTNTVVNLPIKKKSVDTEVEKIKQLAVA